MPGGASQPSTWQPPASMVLTIRWASLQSRLPRPRSRTSDVAAEDGGDDPGFAGQPAGLAGGDGFAGVESGGLESAHQGLEGHENHDGGVEAAGFGEPLGGVALDHLDEGVAEPLGGGPSFPERSLGGAVFGGGVGVEGLLEHGAGQGVEGEPAVDLAAAVVPHRQPGRGGGVAFLALEQFGFVGVGGVGGGDLEDVPAQLLEGFGVVVGGELEQVLLGLEGDVGVEVVGELGQGAEDDLGLLDVDPPLGERGTGRVVARRGPWRAAAPGARPVAVVRVWWAYQFAVEVAPAVAGELDAVRVGKEPGFELGELGRRGR